MAQKITLSIPDLLHDKLKGWRKSFNLSKMFQEALTDAIKTKEDFQKRFSEDFDMPEIIKRLQLEKFTWEKKFLKIGKLEGLKWARIAPYENLLYVLNFEDTYKIISDPLLSDYFDQIYNEIELEKYSNTGAIDHEQMFIDGWTKGVKEFWEQVKEKLK
jgi:hypothetical protein